LTGRSKKAGATHKREARLDRFAPRRFRHRGPPSGRWGLQPAAFARKNTAWQRLAGTAMKEAGLSKTKKATDF